MLTEIRDRSSGWFAWIIAAIIIIPMAFFGVQQYADTQARPTIVEIDDSKITQQDFQDRLTQIQNQRLQQNPELANSGILNSKEFKTSVLQSMINQELVAYVADEHNYRVSEQQINQQIVDNPLFQVDGKFDQSVFNAQMASYGRTGAQIYRADLERSTRLGQVVSGYQESALVLPSEVRSLLEIQAERRTFDLITVNQADYLDSIEVSEQDIADYYQANIDAYQFPDRVSVEYIELDTESLAATIEVEESVLESAYEDYKAGFASDETRSTRHILLSTNDGEDEQDQLSKAEELVAQLRAGADFAVLAEANSQDPGSASNGGSLGNVERGEMVAEFDEATFALEVGAISDPVKSPFGYHIIQVEKINATEPEPFAAMRFQLLEDEQFLQAEARVVELAEQLRNLLFENAASLEAAASAADVSVQKTGLFSRVAGEGIAANDAVREAAFSQAVMNDEVNSELIETSDGVYVGLRKLDFSPAQPKPLEAVQAQIKTTLVTERAIAAAKETGDKLLNQAQLNWGELTNDDTVAIATHTISMLDTERKVAPDVMREVVKARLDNESTKVFSFTGLNGDFNIVRLTQIAPGNLAAVSDAVKDATRRLIEQRNGASLLETYIESLNEELALEVNEELL